jgi:hypothetical protein
MTFGETDEEAYDRAKLIVDAVAARHASRALRAELDKCGKENCMGQAVEGCRRWVSEERLLQVQAELSQLRKELKLKESMLRAKDVIASQLADQLTALRKDAPPEAAPSSGGKTDEREK